MKVPNSQNSLLLPDLCQRSWTTIVLCGCQCSMLICCARRNSDFIGDFSNVAPLPFSFSSLHPYCLFTYAHACTHSCSRCEPWAMSFALVQYSNLDQFCPLQISHLQSSCTGLCIFLTAASISGSPFSDAVQHYLKLSFTVNNIYIYFFYCIFILWPVMTLWRSLFYGLDFAGPCFWL